MVRVFQHLVFYYYPISGHNTKTIFAPFCLNMNLTLFGRAVWLRYPWVWEWRLSCVHLNLRFQPWSPHKDRGFSDLPLSKIVQSWTLGKSRERRHCTSLHIRMLEEHGLSRSHNPQHSLESMALWKQNLRFQSAPPISQRLWHWWSNVRVHTDLRKILPGELKNKLWCYRMLLWDINSKCEPSREEYLNHISSKYCETVT